MAHPYSPTAWVNNTAPFINATNLNKIEAAILANDTVFNLVKDYGVATGNSGATNTTAIQTAFADAALVGGTVYLPSAPAFYPINPLTLPRGPINFVGDGPTASMMSADPAGAATAMISADPLGLPSSGPFATLVDDPKKAYDGDLTIISNLGLNGLTHWTAGVKGISIVNQGGQRGQFLLDRILVYASNSTSFEIINSGNLWGEILHMCVAYGPDGIGFDLGSDMMVSKCIAANTGFEGFRSLGYGTSLQMDSCKAFGNGTALASRGVGYYFGSNGAGISLTNSCAQDCGAEGLVIEDSGAGESHNITVTTFIADSCSSRARTTYSGVRLSDCHDVQVTGYVSTDRFYNSFTSQVHGLKVTNAAAGNQRNVVEMVQSPTDEGRGYPTMLSPVDPASDLSGTDVTVGGSRGGVVTVPYNATFTPDPYKARTNSMSMTGNVTTVAAPANLHHGCQLRLLFLASGGSRTIPANASWNAVYKLNGLVPQSATIGQRLVYEFEYDAVNALWVQTNPASGPPVWF